MTEVCALCNAHLANPLKIYCEKCEPLDNPPPKEPQQTVPSFQELASRIADALSSVAEKIRKDGFPPAYCCIRATPDKAEYPSFFLALWRVGKRGALPTEDLNKEGNAVW